MRLVSRKNLEDQYIRIEIQVVYDDNIENNINNNNSYFSVIKTLTEFNIFPVYKFIFFKNLLQ